jgi:hypothetical protein
MAKIFGSDGSLRGCFIVFDLDLSFSHGAVVELPSGASPASLPDRSRGAAYPLVVVGISIQQQERTFFLPCFGDNIFGYAFGNNVGRITVNFAGFLDKGRDYQPSGSGDVVDVSCVTDFLNAYSSSRISKSRETAIVSFGQNGSLVGYIVSMSMDTMNVAANIMSFSLVLQSVDVQGDIDTGGATPTAATTAATAVSSAAAGLAAQVAQAVAANVAANGSGSTTTQAEVEESQAHRAVRESFSNLDAANRNAVREQSESNYDSYSTIRGTEGVV